MASKQKAPEGVLVKILGYVLPLKVVTEREIEVRHGKKVVDTIVEKLDAPYAILTTKPEAKSSGIWGVPGRIVDVNGVHTPDALGETYIIVNGEKVALAMVPGLTKQEGAVTKQGAPAKRNPKFDLGNEDVLVTWNGSICRVELGVSQTGDNSLFLWGTLRPVAERKEPAAKKAAKVTNLADFAVSEDLVALR